MPENKDLDDELRDLIGKIKKTAPPGSGPAIHAGRDVNYAEAGGHLVIDRRKTIIVHPSRQADELLADDQLAEDETPADQIGPPGNTGPQKPKKPPRGGFRLLSLAAILVALVFSTSNPPALKAPAALTPVPPPVQAAIQPTIAIDTTRPLIVTAPGWHIYAGCSFIRPPRPIAPQADKAPQSI